MDVTPQPFISFIFIRVMYVSILVLMDVTLQLPWDVIPAGMKVVSILVLMDVTLQRKTRAKSTKYLVSFNPCFNGCYSSTIIIGCYNFLYLCFNPCFNGCYSSTSLWELLWLLPFCFNPCFNGCYSSTRYCISLHFCGYLVSILVLMDVTPQQGHRWFFECLSAVSILVLMDVTLQRYQIYR